MMAIMAGVMLRNPSLAVVGDDAAADPCSFRHKKEIDARAKLSFTSAGAIPYTLT
jgi:hypothetical protein